MTRWGRLAEATWSQKWIRHMNELGSKTEDIIVYIDPSAEQYCLRSINSRLHSSRRLESFHCRWIRFNVHKRLSRWYPYCDVIQFYGYHFVVVKLEITQTRVYTRLFVILNLM